MKQTTPTDESKAEATPTDDNATPTSEESTQQEKSRDLKPISEVQNIPVYLYKLWFAGTRANLVVPIIIFVQKIYFCKF